MEFISIKAKNFRSYDKLELEFNHLGLTLLSGVNKSSDNDSSNGSGKTTAMYVALFALFGELPDGSKGDDVIKLDKGKNCLAQVTFKHLKHTFTVKRYRKDSEYKNKIILLKDDKDITLSTNKETDNKITELLGFGYDTFMNTIMFSPEKVDSFVSSTDKQRKTMLEELTNTNIYKQAEKMVKDDRLEARDSLSDVAKDIDNTTNLIEAQKGVWSQYKQNLTILDNQKNQLNSQIQELLPQTINDVADTATLDKLNNEIKSIKDDIDKLDLKPVNTANQAYMQQQQIANNLQKELKNKAQQVTDLINSYKKLLNSKSPVCEWCGSVLDLDHKQKELTNIKQKIKDSLKELAGLKNDYKASQANLIKLKGDKDRENQANATKYQKSKGLNDAYQAKQKQLYEYQSRINQQENAKKQVTNLRNQLEQLENKKVEAPKQTDKNKLQTKLNQLNKKAEKLKTEIDHLDQLVKVYSDKGVKSQALSLVIPYLNDKLKDYLAVLTDNNINAYLSSTSKTKTGKTNNSISLNINSSSSGNQFEELSSGEKRRISIALNLAFMSYLSDQVGGINLVFFDEIFDHLDLNGVNQVVALLKKIDIDNTIVISHNDDLKYNDNFDSHLVVKRIDNSSRLLYN